MGPEPDRGFQEDSSCKFDDPAFDADDSYEHSDAAKNLIDEFGKLLRAGRANRRLSKRNEKTGSVLQTAR